MAGKPIIEEIDPRCTRRTCSDCPSVATHWRYTRNVEGKKNASSRQPVCSEHAQPLFFNGIQYIVSPNTTGEYLGMDRSLSYVQSPAYNNPERHGKA